VLAGNQSRAIECYRQAIDLFGEFADRYEQSQTLTSLGDTYQAVSQPREAEKAWRQALAILDDLGHPGARNVRARLSGGRRRRPARPA
jgi:tetratricopeptide (TPR) repeat protein